MVLLIIIPIKWLFHWEYPLFSDKPMEFTLYMQIQMVHLADFQTNHAGICP